MTYQSDPLDQRWQQEQAEERFSPDAYRLRRDALWCDTYLAWLELATRTDAAARFVARLLSAQMDTLTPERKARIWDGIKATLDAEGWGRE